MYRPDEITNGFFGLWGWRQNQNTSDFTIADGLTESASGQYYQDVHPLVTLDNIKAIAPDFGAVTYQSWDAATQYRVGDRVEDDSKTYRAKEANIGKKPETNPEAWERFDAFSEWLEQKTKSSILKAIRSFWDEKMASRTARNILENKTLFTGAGRIVDVIPNGENLVGFEIVPIRANGVTTKIEKIGLQFSGTGTITMYLMHSSQVPPVKQIELTRTKNASMEWFDLSDWYLPYVSGDTDAGGSWYLVYDQNAMGSMQAINKSKDWSKKPCSHCDSNELLAYNIWSKYLEIHPFKTQAGESVEMWDLSDNLYTYTTNYGINLQISIECDATDLMVNQRNAFQSVIGLQVAADMLREFAYNPNFKIGRAQQNFSRMEILYELDGDSQSYKKSGLMYDLKKAMEAVSIDAKAMSRVCFPCNNKGVRFRTV